MLHSAHVEARLLGELRDAWPVVVVQRVVCQDGIRHLWVCHQVDLQQLLGAGMSTDAGQPREGV